MASKSIRNGINAGTVFAVILIFLALIDFTTTGAVLVSRILGNPPSVGARPDLFFFVLFMGLLGIANGALAARPGEHEDKLKNVFIPSLVAGGLTGLVIAVFSLIYGWLLAKNIDPRPYLAMVSPDSMQTFLFQQSPGIAFFLHLILMTVSSVLGGLLAFGLRKASLRQRLRAWFQKTSATIREQSLVKQLRRAPYTIYIIYLLIAIVLFFLPRAWGSYWNYIIGTVGIYVILGLGLNIIVGLAGQLVLGYVAFFAIGAYSIALLTAPKPHHLLWNFWVVLLIAVVLAALTGILLGLPILRLRGDYLAIVTLGFGEIIRILMQSDLMSPYTGGPRGVPNIGGPTLLGKLVNTDVDFMYLIFLAVALIIFITNRLQNSRTGRAWVAIREDEVAARATGINTFQSKLLALAIGAAFAGLGGVLFASRNQFTGPEDHTLMVSINVLALVIVGGMGSIPGVILGSFALKGLPEMLRELDIYRLMFFGALLVVMMILRPEGLWPATRPSMEAEHQKKDKPKEEPAVQQETQAAKVEGD
jgi:ABC-type branched-subunit amino acid transport system permease subunit